MEKEYIIKEFEDLLNLLRERPDYLEKLRMLILTKELLELPVKFEEFRREVSQRFEEIDRRFDEVDRRFEEIDRRFDEVDKRFEESDKKFEAFRSEVNKKFEEVDKRLEKLEIGQEEIKQKLEKHDKEIEEIKQILDRHEKSIQELKGWQLEHKVFINICSYLASYIGIRKCKIKDKSELLEELDEYVEKGIITEEEENDVIELDLIVSGILKETKEEVYVAIEISYKIGNYDIERVIRRKEILEKVYKKKVIPLIIGKEISNKLKSKLKKLNVEFVLVK
jgi:DNA repair exonuclease SbcCD ATPase subunit